MAQAKQKQEEDQEEMPLPPPIDVSTGGELQIASSVASATQEIQAAIFLSKKFPRNYDAAWAAFQLACRRETLAKSANYSYPRAGQNITGPSVYLARAGAQCYGNVRYGITVLRDDVDSMSIEGFAWDIENNIKVTYPDTFKKLIYRKKAGWVKPDERDLRELVFRRGAILVRNALLSILPRDYIEDAQAICRETLTKGIKDPAGEKKRIILEYQQHNISVEMISKYLGHEDWTGEDLVNLREMLNAIKDGMATVNDYFRASGDEKEAPATGTLSPDDMKAGDASTRQGYEKQPETTQTEKAKDEKPTAPPQNGKAKPAPRAAAKTAPPPEKPKAAPPPPATREDLEKELLTLLVDNEASLWPELLEQYKPESIKEWSADQIRQQIKVITSILAKRGGAKPPSNGDGKQTEMGLKNNSDKSALPKEAEF